MIGSGFHASLVHNLSRKSVIGCLTLFSVWNLDFFRLILPPVCVSTSTKTINVLLFDSVVAFYLLFLTVFILMGIELYDSSCPTLLKVIFHKRKLNPKETILKTCATFLLLSYSKFLFVSINLLLAVPIYNCNSRGDLIPASAVLLYEPTIRFLHSEHIPYIIFALFVIVVFVLLPPLLLLLYPTRIFRARLKFVGFKRWDILHLIMDIFQGWFKDGTDNFVDYRPFSAFYMLLRILCALLGVTILLNMFTQYHWTVLGLFHVILGALFLTIKPYKKNWMNRTDGLILFVLGSLMMTIQLSPKFTFIIATVIATPVIATVSLYFISKYVKKYYFV